jgi:hypothetical protein
MLPYQHLLETKEIERSLPSGDLMPGQADHEKPENLMQSPLPKIHRARSLPEEANSNNSLDGYAAMNVPARKETIDEILAEDEQGHQKSRKDSS